MSPHQQRPPAYTPEPLMLLLKGGREEQLLLILGRSHTERLSQAVLCDCPPGHGAATGWQGKPGPPTHESLW